MTTLRSPLEEHAARYREHAEMLLDEALRETFPASDPISVFVGAPRGLAIAMSLSSVPVVDNPLRWRTPSSAI